MPPDQKWERLLFLKRTWFAEARNRVRKGLLPQNSHHCRRVLSLSLQVHCPTRGRADLPALSRLSSSAASYSKSRLFIQTQQLAKSSCKGKCLLWGMLVLSIVTCFMAGFADCKVAIANGLDSIKNQPRLWWFPWGGHKVVCSGTPDTCFFINAEADFKRL